MSNKSEGTRFERAFAKILFDHGFFAHCVQDNKNGQPFDVFAMRHGRGYCFDCKDCQSGRFDFSRIEENQRNAFLLLERTGNYPGMFALRLPEGIYLITYKSIRNLESDGILRLSADTIRQEGIEIAQWMKWRDYPCS